MRFAVCFVLVLAIGVSLVDARRSLLAKNSCENPPKNKLDVPGGDKVLVLNAKGDRTFWCNGGEFEYTKKGKLHGDQKGNLTSSDGQWTGTYEFREDGKPAWDIKNKKTGESATIVALQRPDYRKDENNDMTWDRRSVYEQTGDLPTIKYVIRSNTTSGKLPKSCKGDNDAIVPFTAKFTFIAC